MRLTDRIGRHLKLRDLHILLTVAERGRAKAAEDLAISQPVISKTIAELEHAVGVRLLDRSRQGVEPTPHGRALMRRSLIAFDELREGIREIDFLNDPAAGEVRVGALAAMIAGLMPEVIGRMHARYPRLVVHVMQMFTSPTVYDNLRQRKQDNRRADRRAAQSRLACPSWPARTTARETRPRVIHLSKRGSPTAGRGCQQCLPPPQPKRGILARVAKLLLVQSLLVRSCRCPVQIWWCFILPEGRSSQ
jgi:DNA-binding transcriptional LysR family regulator